MAVKFSVLIPAYNVESYIGRCLDSVLSQTCHDYELIIINDGSKDTTYEICKSYAARNRSILVHTQENHGIAYTRNCLLDKAKGEWIAFVDADDYVEPNYLEAFEEAILAFPNSDAFCSDKNDVFKNRKWPVRCQFTSKKDFLIQVFDSKPAKRCVWGKIIRRSLIERTGIRFEKGINMGEDILFVSRVLYFSTDVKHVPAYIYNHNRENENSLTKGMHGSFLSDKISYSQLIDDFYKSQPDYQIYKKSIYNMLFGNYIECYLYAYIKKRELISIPQFKRSSLYFKHRIYQLLVQNKMPFVLRVARRLLN